LEEYEEEHLSRYHYVTMSASWEDIEDVARHRIAILKKLPKKERKIKECNEQAYWKVYTPPPESWNVTEANIMKNGRARTLLSEEKVVKQKIQNVEDDLKKACLDCSQACSSILKSVQQSQSFDPMCNPPSNNHLTTANQWESPNEVTDFAKWGISFKLLMNDKRGREKLREFMEKEYSSENLDFWEKCKTYKSAPKSQYRSRANFIRRKFLSNEDTSSINSSSPFIHDLSKSINSLDLQEVTPINIDQKLRRDIEEGMEGDKKLDRWLFEDARQHIHELMRTDTYPRFLKSDVYRNLLIGKK